MVENGKAKYLRLHINHSGGLDYKPVVDNLAVFGDITISGMVIEMDEFANSLQVCLGSEAKKVMIPSLSFVDLASVLADLMSVFQLFYQSTRDVVFKALGVVN